MGILVRCPNGHVFKVKDKYAGKKGLCPLCIGQQVVVQVPDLMTTASDTIKHTTGKPATYQDPGNSSIFEDQPTTTGTTSSGSLLSNSFIQHHVLCTHCGEKAPMWYARCPACGEYLDHS
ncbi:MAG: hypothetical protein JW829_08715 [Pirellulales bacterium]|nr:hypothetical protein [Pirellulales bacterium]